MKTAKPTTITEALLSGKTPIPVRIGLLRQLVEVGDEQALTTMLEAAAGSDGKTRYKAKIKELEVLISQLEDGPLRLGTFLRVAPGAGTRAMVRLPDGSTAVSQVLDSKLAPGLRRGDTVGLDARCKAVLLRFDSDGEQVGEQARLERVLDPTRVEISLREGGERHVFLTSADLERELAEGSVEAGRSLLVEPQQRMAFAALPVVKGAGQGRYLATDPVPDVLVERDVGDPAPFLDELTEHIESELTSPGMARAYGLRRCAMHLLTGVPGCGKTLSVQAMWRRMYEVMERTTGAAMEDLPPRVMRFRASTVLSKWLGESDKHIDRFFDELEALADEPWVDADGREHELPVLAIFEEIDGIARQRGEDAVHDRIQTTLLQRLDVTAHPLGRRLIVFLFTSNCPELVDPAFQRRAGARVTHFGRLERRGFEAVLTKQLGERPLARVGHEDARSARARCVAQLSGWLYGPTDPPLIELDIVGQTGAQRRFRRDFLTGGLLDRTVQAAAAEACRGERLGEAPGMTPRHLVEALDRQVETITRQLRPDNARSHLDLADGLRVSAVRRLPRASALPASFERAQ
jgi:ATP-dependent 26S proteasome regulatory subunit